MSANKLENIIKISKANYEILLAGGSVKGHTYDPNAFYLVLDEGNIIYIKYDNLKELRNNNALIPGLQYRIIDYECTTLQENTKSAGHLFDIIVTADSENTLNENARAIQHEGDTYFKDNKLNAWELKYCLDNDCDRFEWADDRGGYFYLETLEDGNVGFHISEFHYELIEDLKYSLDGDIWISVEGIGEGGDTEIALKAGQKVFFKGNNYKGINDCVDWNEEDDNHFYSDIKVNIGGNIMTLMYDDGKNETLKPYCFSNLFGGMYDGEETTCVANANKLLLPAKVLTDYCYYSMFSSCASLATAPALPASTLAKYCYYNMFGSCVSLTKAPELPAMNLATNCYRYMFQNCTSLKTAPELPATTLASYCYSHMFYSCTSLTTAPELPATTLASYCYGCMFYNCTSLVTAPELPVTTLADYCYSNMFRSCTSLTTTPELPATNLANDCYSWMFYNCTNLKYVKCLATDISAYNCTNNWLYNVSPTGTFVKANQTSWSRGVSGIPNGWNIETDCLYFEALEDNCGLGLYSSNSNTFEVSYSFDNATWNTLPISTSTPYTYINVPKNSKIFIKSTNDYMSTSDVTHRFVTRNKFNVGGNIKSLINNNEDLTQYCFRDLFSGANIVDASKLLLPFESLNQRCYSGMFAGCVSLLSAPELPATSLDKDCYTEMFLNCNNLINASKELPALYVSDYAYFKMFMNCHSLVKAPIILALEVGINSCAKMFMSDNDNAMALSEIQDTLYATTLGEGCYLQMFLHCSFVTAPKLPALTLSPTCYKSMFLECTNLCIVPALPAVVLTKECYCRMFCGCTSLNTISTTRFLDWDESENATTDWLLNVSTSGRFLSYNLLNKSTRDASHVPAGWTLNNIFIPTFTNYTEYLHFTAENGADIKLASSGDNVYIPNLEYSKDGSNWSTFTSSTGIRNIISLSAGQTVYIRGLNNIHFNKHNSYNKFVMRNTGGNVYVAGNIMSLYNKDYKLPMITEDWGLNSLFYNCTIITDAYDLQLPAMQLSQDCYTQMFRGCTNLVRGPKELPATNVPDYAYHSMFRNCESLTYQTEIKATKVGAYSCQNMFRQCYSLTTPQEILPATTLGESCYYYMYGMSVLNKCPKLPAMTLTECCYQNMFVGCPIEIAPELPATTLAPYCYNEMFAADYDDESKCILFTKSPALHASKLSDSCYYGMFAYTNVLPDCSNIDFNSAEVVASGGLKGLFARTKVKDSDLDKILPHDSNGNYCLPVMTLANECYNSMFEGCAKLATAPKLLATNLAGWCYNGMFYGCSSLANAPALPASSLVEGCYSYMFGECTSLVNAPKLPATTLASYCYLCMFSYCSSLQTAPELPATSLSNGCYQYLCMFSYCSSLQTAPELPATSLSNSCYQYMFEDCTSLTTAPALPATTLTNNCYNSMFSGCSSLVNAPELPAITLVEGCYSNMFISCTSLKNISVNFTDWRTDIYATNYWVGNISTIGVFQKPAALPTNTGSSYIPSGWNVIDDKYLVFVAEESSTIGITNYNNTPQLYYSLDKGSSWIYWNGNGFSTITLNTGQTLYMYGNNTSGFSKGTSQYSQFNINGKVSVHGNVNALLSINNEISTIPCTYCFYRLFDSCYGLYNANGLKLPATTLKDYCYNTMFSSCSNLLSLPKLPAINLALYCYLYMFNNCSNLKNSLELPATNLVTGCYKGMFSNCHNLINAPKLLAVNLASECYSDMFSYCSSLITAPELPATKLVGDCYYYMFAYCYKLKNAPILSATKLTCRVTKAKPPKQGKYFGCYQAMFMGCTSLQKVVCLATDISAVNATADWLVNVSSSGTFIKNKRMEDWEEGTSGIPSGWKVKDYEDDENALGLQSIGKGVIYYMKDEWNNEVPYDFKNILFKRWKITASSKACTDIVNTYSAYNTRIFGVTIDTKDYIWCYTFNEQNNNIVSSNTRTDGSMQGMSNYITDNSFSNYLFDNKMLLNNIVFHGTLCFENKFDNDCVYLTFGNYSRKNSAKHYFQCNIFGVCCCYNIFAYNVYENIFGNNCQSNTFGTECYSNTFISNCYSNTFGNQCLSNTFTSYCYNNVFGNNCCNNMLGKNCWDCTFGNYCYNIVLDNQCEGTIIDNICANLELLYNGEEEMTDDDHLRNIHIHQGVHGEYRDRKIINIDVLNNDYQIDIRTKNDIVKYID